MQKRVSSFLIAKRNAILIKRKEEGRKDGTNRIYASSLLRRSCCVAAQEQRFVSGIASLVPEDLLFCVVLWALKGVVEDEEEDKDTVINCYQLYT